MIFILYFIQDRGNKGKKKREGYIDFQLIKREGNLFSVGEVVNWCRFKEIGMMYF